MTALLLLPTVASLLLAAAHFLRAGQTYLVVVSLALIALTAVPRRWAAYVLQGTLVLIAGEWVRVTVVLASLRRSLDQPSGRLVLILGGVALLALAATLLLRSPPLRRRFR